MVAQRMSHGDAERHMDRVWHCEIQRRQQNIELSVVYRA